MGFLLFYLSGLVSAYIFLHIMNKYVWKTDVGGFLAISLLSWVVFVGVGLFWVIKGAEHLLTNGFSFMNNIDEFIDKKFGHGKDKEKREKLIQILNMWMYDRKNENDPLLVPTRQYFFVENDIILQIDDRKHKIKMFYPENKSAFEEHLRKEIPEACL